MENNISHLNRFSSKSNSLYYIYTLSLHRLTNYNIALTCHSIDVIILYFCRTRGFYIQFSEMEVLKNQVLNYEI